MSCKSLCCFWKKWTQTTISLLILVTCLVGIIIFLILSRSVINFSTEIAPTKTKTCVTEGCIQSARAILKMVDKTIDPCDNFYDFVCGKFMRHAVVPEEKTSVNTFSLISEKVNLQFKNLLEEAFHPTDSKALKLLKTVYKSCMNTTRTEKQSLFFVKKIFKELGGWPVVEPVWNEKKFDWKQVLYKLRRNGWYINIFVKMQVAIDLRNSSRRIVTITQPNIFAYSALRRGFNDTETQAYYDFMVKTTSLFGASKLSASVEMNEVLYFEMNLTQIAGGVKGNEYNPMTIKELQQTVRNIPWLQLVNNFLAPVEMLTSASVVNVPFLKYLIGLEDLVLNTRKRIVANYMFWHMLRNSLNHLPQNFRDQVLEYNKVSKGVTKSKPRWEQCVSGVNKLHVAASAVYVEKFFNRKNKEEVMAIASNIKKAFIETLQEAEWLDQETKDKAVQKTEQMDYYIGYPEELLDRAKIDEYYEGLELKPDDHFLRMYSNLSAFLHRKYVKRLKKPVSKPDWIEQSYSYDVNGFYDQRANGIEIMAALIQDHFYYSGRPHYVNYASIGEVIGHEFTHSLDNQGRQYDEKGNLLDWWSSQTLEDFKRKSRCLIEQYGNLTVPEVGLKLNGVKTLDENIADHGGFKFAYKGYLKWVEENGEEGLLPGLNYTQRQIFWIQAASDSCFKYKKETLKKFVMSGRHAPGFYRVMVPFMNSEEFSNDFNCSVGSNMNPENKCTVW